MIRHRRRFLASLQPVFLLLAVLALPGCSAVAPAPTATPLPPTPLPTATATLPPPTFTPLPTPTRTATPTPIPTPAQVGDKATVGNLEITLVGTATHDLIVPGGLYYYYPTDRTQYFLDVGVLIRDLEQGHTTSLPIQSVFVMEEDEHAYYPAFADYKTVERGAKFDPFTVGIATETTPGLNVFISKDTYLRLIFVIDKHQTILFGIGDSPQFVFEVP